MPPAAIIEVQTPGFYIKRRFLLAIMCSLGLLNMYTTRNNINIAIVAMVNATTSYAKSTNVTEICPDVGFFKQANSNSNGIFSWNTAQQGLVMGSYFYGYVFSNIPGAWLARRYGFKLILGTSLFISSFLTILVPFVAYRSFTLLVTLRIVIGFVQGVTYPTVIGVWSKWSPPLERSILSSMSLSGGTLGTVFIYMVGGTIASKWGWEAVFYFSGVLAFLWSVLWFFIIHDDPTKHPRISEQEKVFIVESIKAESSNEENDDKIPWKAIFTSRPVWAIIIACVADAYGDYGMSTMLPTYMTTILKVDLASSGIFVALPYGLKWLAMNVLGHVTDRVLAKQWLTTISVRKLNQTVASVGSAFCLLLACYVGCNINAAVLLFCLAITFNGLGVCGSETNTLDIAPQYAGIIYAILNTFANCCGFISPQIAGFILLGENNLAQWRIFFWTAAIILLVGSVMYLSLASAHIQKWAKGNKKETTEVKLLDMDNRKLIENL